MSHGTFVWTGAGSAGACPGPMTRADLLALRSAGTLSPQCTYVITDYNVGRLGAGTQIQLHAVTGSVLSENVSVYTVYDNEAWAGTYDIDINRVLSLQDNRGNTVSDRNGTAVSVFDWGNLAISQCTVANGTWAQTIGSVRPMIRVRVEDGGILTTVGMTGGNLQNVTVSSGASVNVSGSNMNLTQFVAEQSATVNAANFTAASTFMNTTVSTGAILNVSGTTSSCNLTRVIIEQGGAVNHLNVTTGTMALQGVTVSAGTITRGTTAGTCTIVSTTVERGGSISHTHPATMSVTASTVGSSGTITGSGAAALVAVQQSTVLSGVINVTAGAMNMTRSTVGQQGQVVKTAGAATMNVFNCVVSGSGSNLTQTTTGTANVTFTDVTCANGGFVLQTGGGVLNVSASQMLESGRINHQGARNLTVTRVTCTELGVITHNCPTAGTDTIGDTSLSGRAQMSMTQTGANPVNVQWSRLAGISGALNVTGTTGTVGVLALNRITADNGTVAASSTGAATIQFITVTGSSNVTVSTASPITASQIAVSEAGQVKITGATGNVSNVHVWSAGSVTIPGGRVNALQKSFSSTLNTGAFAHTNIGHHTGTSKTLTAANTNRVDHMGLAAQLV